MTIIDKINRKCAVCTKTSKQSVIISSNALGFPDLDLRPSQMYRNTMFAWLDECPECGYIATNIEQDLEVEKDILKSNEYLTCSGIDFKSDLSKQFYKYYLISKARNNSRAKFFSLLYCAWTCDDVNDELAFDVRKLALKSIDEIFAQTKKEENRLKLIKADLYRRTRQFDRLINEFKDLILEDEALKLNNRIKNDIITFQIELARKKDSDCYTLKDVKNNRK